MEQQEQNMEGDQDNPMNTIPTGDMKPEQKSHGALIGSLIIIIILIVGGIYLFKDKSDDLQEEPENALTEEFMENEEIPGADIELSPSDELGDIEADLDATDNMELDAGLE